MIALPPVDPADFIMKAGDEMQKCIRKYFTDISLEDAARGELLDPKYSPALLGELRSEYLQKLESIWDSIPMHYRSSFEAAYEAPVPEQTGDLEALQNAYEAAVKRTLREKLGKDYKDIVQYKHLLKNYCESLLQAMHARFVEAVVKQINR